MDNRTQPAPDGERYHLRIRELMAFVVALSLALVSLIFASELWAGVVVMVTVATLLVAVLGVVYRRGRAQAGWLGFGLFGWAYLAAVWWAQGESRPNLITSTLLEHVQPYLQVRGSPAASALRFLELNDPKSARILAKLEEPISMSFANETPLEDVLKYIKSATQGPHEPQIQIYVDPLDLQEAEKTIQSPVQLDLEGVPLKLTLELLLRQLGLRYEVRGGVLTITKGSPSDAFQRIGHCYCALIAASLGAMAGRSFFGGRGSAPARSLPPVN